APGALPGTRAPHKRCALSAPSSPPHACTRRRHPSRIPLTGHKLKLSAFEEVERVGDVLEVGREVRVVAQLPVQVRPGRPRRYDAPGESHRTYHLPGRDRIPVPATHLVHVRVDAPPRGPRVIEDDAVPKAPAAPAIARPVRPRD